LEKELINSNLESYKERISSFNNDFEFTTLIYVIRKSVIYFITALIIALFLAFLYLRYTPPVYESQSVIQLNVSNQASDLLKVYSNFGESDELKSEIEIMRSPLIIQRTIKKLPLSVGYFTQGTLLEHNKYGSNSFKIYDIEILDSSILGKKLFINEESNSTFTITDETGSINYNTQVTEDNPFSNKWFKAKLLIISYAQFQTEATNDRLFFVLQSPKILLPEMRAGLDVKIEDPSAKTVVVSFKHNNPRLCSDFVNQLLIEYDDYIIGKKSQSGENILNFIKEQKDTVDKRVKESEQMIQIFQKSNDLKGTTGLSSSYMNQLSSLEQEQSRLSIERSVLEHLENTVRNFSEETNVDEIIPALIGRSFESTLQSLIIELKTAVAKRKEMLYNNTLENNNVKKLDLQIKDQINLILKSIKVV
jgi:tyrosine-protein kinase Etk/Wzc